MCFSWKIVIGTTDSHKLSVSRGVEDGIEKSSVESVNVSEDD